MALRVGQTLYAFSAVVGLALGVAGTICAYQLNELRVGGPVYQRLVEGKDLVADILPPPAYVVEAFLDLTLSRYGSLTISKAEAELSRLKTEYDARIDHWQNSGLPEDVKSLLLEAADRPAREFWSIVETSYLPAIRNRDTVARDSAYAEIQRTFDEHRNGIATLVGSATELNASLEEGSRVRARSATVWQFGSIAFAMAILLLGILSLRRRVIAPLVKLTEAMRALASGRLDTDVPMTKRDDEIGAMAEALKVFRVSESERSTLAAETEAQRADADAEQERRLSVDRSRTNDLKSFVENIDKGFVAPRNSSRSAQSSTGRSKRSIRRSARSSRPSAPCGPHFRQCRLRAFFGPARRHDADPRECRPRALRREVERSWARQTVHPGTARGSN